MALLRQCRARIFLWQQGAVRPLYADPCNPAANVLHLGVSVHSQTEPATLGSLNSNLHLVEKAASFARCAARPLASSPSSGWTILRPRREAAARRRGNMAKNHTNNQKTSATRLSWERNRLPRGAFEVINRGDSQWLMN